MTVLLLLATSVTMLLGYANKARCLGPAFGPDGRSSSFDAIKNSSVCYSDIQMLWLGREINNHVFPYVDGSITADGTLVGGSVEYPVLSGLLMWLGALPAETDAQFLLVSALLMAPFGLGVAWALGRLAGRRAFLWAATPPLVLYAFHNWELPVVACAVGAVWLMARWDASLVRRATWAAVLLAVGFSLKLYPGIFVLPLALLVLTAGGRGSLDWRGAGRVVGAAVATVVAVNLPFVVLGFEGWWAAYQFQGQRSVDVSTNSIWYWGLRPALGLVGDPLLAQALSSILSPLLVLASFGVAVWWGWRRWAADGTYPWVAVSAAMLCGFLLLHKVHSPQYTLWLLPFLVLFRVPWAVVGAYLVTDVLVGVGIFRYFDVLGTAGSGAAASPVADGLALGAVVVGVAVRSALLVWLYVWFLRVDPVADVQGPAG